MTPLVNRTWEIVSALAAVISLGQFNANAGKTDSRFPSPVQYVAENVTTMRVAGVGSDFCEDDHADFAGGQSSCKSRF